MTSSRRTRLWLLSGLLATLVLAGVGAHLWQRHVAVERLRAALPAVPDLAGWPPILEEKIRGAMAATGSPRALRGAIAELGRLYHANRFHAEAERCWRLLRAAEPESPRWAYYLADLRAGAGDQETLEACLRETLRLAPGYAPARLRLANLQLKTGQLEQAAEAYRLCLQAVPGDPHARLGLARVALQEGSEAEARILLESILRDTPNFSTAHNLYAALLTRAGDEAGASRHRWLGQETLRYRDPGDPWIEELDTWCYDYDHLCMRGTIEYLDNDPAAAGDYFRRAIQARPGDSRGHELLAGLHLDQGEPAAALDQLAQADLRLTGAKSHHFFTTLSRAQRELGRTAEAVQAAHEGLARHPDEPELHDALGLALADAGRHEEAVQAWRAGLAKKPGDASMNYNQAVSLLALGRLDEALAALDRSLTQQPTFLPTLLLRGEIELEAGHLDQAERYLRAAIETHPAEPRARRFLATLHLRRGAEEEADGNLEAAEGHYRDGLAREAQHPGLLLRLGALHLTRRRFDEALAPLESYHAMAPTDPHGCLFLGQAYAATRQLEKAGEILSLGAQLADQAGKTATAGRCRSVLAQLRALHEGEGRTREPSSNE